MSKYSISKIIPVLFLIIFGLYLFLPSISNAALVPCGLREDDKTTTNFDESQSCTLCHLVVGIKGLIDFGFKIMVVVGLVMLVAAGIIYIVSAGNEGMMETAKGLMKNALIGFSLILGAWLIVNTIMWIMGTKESSDEGGVLGIKVTGWNTFTCSRTRKATTGTTNASQASTAASANANAQQSSCGIDGIGTCYAGSWYSQCPSGMVVASSDNINCGSGKYCCTTVEKISQAANKIKCGTNDVGRCYLGSWYKYCSGMYHVGGGNDCPSGSYCCAATSK